jgi:hypothetical protein
MFKVNDEVRRTRATKTFRNGSTIRTGDIRYVVDVRDDGKIRVNGISNWMFSSSFEGTGNTMKESEKAMDSLSDEAKKILGL